MRYCLSLLAFVSCLCGAPDDVKLLGNLKYRSIGPYRGGRVVTVAGVPSQPNVYYFGGTGGGIWKTLDGGIRWSPVSDGQLKTGSVGSIAVADSDANIVYAGMGEQAIRGNASHGDGVYKSVDAGKSWKHVGLAETRQIGRVRIHPKNADVVYVCALGHMSGANAERGVYKSLDGGTTWKQLFTRGDNAGCVDLILDPANPNILYAGFWQVFRTPYSMESGGAGSGLFKSTDAGATWTEIGHNPGAPKGMQGKIGVTVSPVNPDRLWAIIEAEDGGVFRSDNAGRTWTRVNEQRMLRQRAWYYSRIYADPIRPNTVYVLNTGFYRSDDGGKTYTGIPVPHGDNHDLWVAPNDSRRMVQSNDGGANVSSDAGATWTNQNHPTAQFYRVALDEDFPYGIYGAQQDNSTIKIKSRGNSGAITDRDWHDVGGGESGWIAPDPKNLNIVYAGSYGGLLTRYDHRTGQTRTVNVWPDNPMGAGVEAMKYRFQWNFPLLFSPHDPKLLYAGGNMLFQSTTEGQSWQPISPDLTRDDKSKQGPTGGPITKDNTSVEYYSTIFTVDESKVAKGVIWTGSDDGLVHVTRDGGKKWDNVTPKTLMPEWIQINSIEASPHDPAKAFFAGTMYKSDDHKPYLFRTRDYGKTWEKIVRGIPDSAFTRVIREDPNRKGLLFAGTETGLYLSMDDGGNWEQFQLNLPVVPITDLAFHKRESELVIATQGRSFWVFDDLLILHQLSDTVRNSEAHLFTPKPAYRYAGGGGGGGGRGPAGGQNPPNGVVVQYTLKNKPQGELTLEIMDPSGKLVKKFSSIADKNKTANTDSSDDDDAPRPATGPTLATTDVGINRFVWDMRYPDSTSFPGMIYWAGNSRGPVAVPAAYTVKLAVDGKVYSQPFTIKKDPRTEGSIQDLQKQLDLSLQIRDKVSQANDAVIKIRDARKQVDELVARAEIIPSAKAAVEAGKKLAKALTDVEQELYQTKNQSNQDPLNYPIRLNNKLAALLSSVQNSDTGPTVQSNQAFEDLATKTNGNLRRLDSLLANDLASFNKLVRDSNIPAVMLK